MAHLSGEITLDGKPLPADALASVTFHPIGVTQARPATAQIAGSRYDCVKAPTGKVLAKMNISIPTGRTYHSERTGQEAMDLEDVRLSADQADGIELEVTADANVNFELRRNKK